MRLGLSARDSDGAAARLRAASDDGTVTARHVGPARLRQMRQQKRNAWRRLILLAEPQDGREGFVDSPLLVWTDPAHQIAQPSGVDRADLLN